MTMTTMIIENRNDDVEDEDEEQGQPLFVQDLHTSCLCLREPLPQIEQPSSSRLPLDLIIQSFRMSYPSFISCSHTNQMRFFKLCEFLASQFPGFLDLLFSNKTPSHPLFHHRLSLLKHLFPKHVNIL